MAFDKDAFLEHLLVSLRVGGIDMTPVNAPKNVIYEQPAVGNYHAIIYGHAPDYKGEAQPPYKVDVYIYPKEQKLYVQDSCTDPQGNRLMYPNSNGIYPAIHYLKNHGFLGMHCDHWEVEVI